MPVENMYYLGAETPIGLYLFGEDNKFYNVDSEEITDDKIFEFTLEDVLDLKEKMFKELFDFESLELDCVIEEIPVSDIEWEEC